MTRALGLCLVLALVLAPLGVAFPAPSAPGGPDDGLHAADAEWRAPPAPIVAAAPARDLAGSSDRWRWLPADAGTWPAAADAPRPPTPASARVPLFRSDPEAPGTGAACR